MNRRFIGMVVLLLVVAFYALGTGFDFFYRFLYVLLLVTGIGFVWAWLNLRGIDLRVTRDANRGQVGGYLVGQVSIVNRTRMPKSWLEVAEATGPSADTSGRGLALVREQVRSWRIRTYLAKRGVYPSGVVKLVSQDPFGLFRLHRDFLDPNPYIVFPAVEALPDLNPRFAGLPSDSRATRHWEQITTDVSSIRAYVAGDSMRRIHWPYTARMNELMVKEFDMGLSAEAWVLLDMNQYSHYGVDLDDVNNTEELSVMVAASIIGRLMDQSMPVGFAANGDKEHIFRPDSSPEQRGRLMETLSAVRAQGRVPLQEFIYAVRSHLNQFNALTLVTSSVETQWVASLNDLRRQGVEVSVVLVDRSSFGSPTNMNAPLEALSANLIPVYMVRRDDKLNDALQAPVREIPRSWAAGVAGGVE
ncbi:MAG: DUF58 domain-containing protein [Chloroflexi bacterium]|nr:DUF58 domain-containing protein [Chloroflexota bacterium]MCI0864862.1 DUF58 domain-containing protein [Chloroflexota bacterium]MCI0900393.1 DUF58 domain-containing protein [Chloroflexota bacterium]MCI0901872.1 DUF58 domain-containing protein [Chloroflexota bacterium]